MITNRANDRRLRAQLEQDRDLKNQEREMSLRKDVYLSAAETIWAGLSAIGRFSNLDIPHDKVIEAYSEKSYVIAKIHIIAKDETLKAVVAVINELNAAYLRLTVKRVSLFAQKEQIVILKNQISSFAQKRDRMLELIKQFNIEGCADKHRWDVLQRNFDFEQGRISDTIKQCDAVAADLSSRQFEYIKECISESIRLSPLLVPAVCAVRKELELPISEEMYIEMIEEGIRKQESNLNEFIQTVRTQATPP